MNGSLRKQAEVKQLHHEVMQFEIIEEESSLVDAYFENLQDDPHPEDPGRRKSISVQPPVRCRQDRTHVMLSGRFNKALGVGRWRKFRMQMPCVLVLYAMGIKGKYT